MDKVKKIIYWILALSGIVLECIFGFPSTNDGNTYYKEYINKSTPVNLFVKRLRFDYKSYRTGLVIYRVKFGHISYYIFKDSITNKYFKISLFDKPLGYTYEILDLESITIVSHVNKDDLNNPLYGTQENPIPIFDFKGKDKPIQMYCQRDDNTEGYVNVEPTQEEYEHNVITYLTYIMPKKEFNKRFKNK